MLDKGTKVYGASGTEFENVAAEATGSTRRCQMSGCTGVRVYVRWPDGHVTQPCSKGLTQQDDGSYRIG